MNWVKSSFSFANGNCVQVAATGDGEWPPGVQLRDSKDPGGPVLVFTAAEWDAFLAGARAGEFDRIGHG